MEKDLRGVGGGTASHSVMSYLLNPAGQNYMASVGSSPQQYGSPISGVLQPIVSRQKNQGGDVFLWEVPISSGSTYYFDAFGNPTRERRSGPQGVHRTDSFEYYNDLINWVISKNKKKVNLDTNMVESEVAFNSQSLPWKIYSFGRLHQTLTYNTNGTLATAADGLGNTTTFSLSLIHI